jgi:dihydroxyacetone kinase DhaKLM complex PTS-EIIA-like component DhaM
MPAPVLTSAKATYAPGETITINVVYTPRSLTFSGTDQDGLVGTLALKVGAVTPARSDSGTVTKTVDTGSAATFTATA